MEFSTVGFGPLRLLAVATLLLLSPSGALADSPAQPAEQEAASSPPRPTAGWDKGFFVQSPDGKFELRFIGRVQARLAVDIDRGEGDRDVGAAFSVPRARIGLKGHLFTKALRYRLEIDFGKGQVSAKRAYLDYTIAPEWAAVRAGHFKKPFSRQQINSSSKLNLVDRSITDKAFGAGYDLGVMFHNGTKNPLEWAFALVNGTGVSPVLSGTTMSVDPTTGVGTFESGGFSNVPGLFDPMMVFRVGYNHGGIDGYDEVDRKGGGFRFAVAGGAMLDFDAADGTGGAVTGEVDAIFKVAGFSATTALYLGAAQDGDTFGDQALNRIGFHVQVGYLIGGKVHPAFRYARISGLGDEEETSQEVSGGVSVLAFGHNVKWSADVAALAEESLAPSDSDFRVRTQMQVSF